MRRYATARKCRRCLSLIALGIWAVCSPSVATAQLYGIDFRNTLMPASGGMAGTSVAAPQDMISAVNGNAAALTQFQETRVTIGGAFAEATYDLSQTQAVPSLGVLPYAAKSSTPGVVVPAVGAVMEIPEMPLRTVVGLGVFGGAGSGVGFEQVPESNGTSSYLLLLEFAPSVAVEITDRLSVGGSMLIGDGYLSGPFVGSSPMSNAYSLRAGLGLGYELGEATRLGAYWQSTQAFRFQNAAILYGQTQATTVNIGLPQTVGLGISNQALLDGRLLLAADAIFLNWDTAALLQNIYKDQWVMQLGLQYQANQRTKLRLGYALAGNPIDETVGTSLAGVPVPGGVPAVKYLQGQYAVVNPHRFTGGVGITDLLPGLDLDLFAGGMFPASESLGSNTQTSLKSYWIGLGLTWRQG